MCGITLLHFIIHLQFIIAFNGRKFHCFSVSVSVLITSSPGSVPPALQASYGLLLYSAILIESNLYICMTTTMTIGTTTTVHVVKAIHLQHYRSCCWINLWIHYAVSVFSSPSLRALSVIIYLLFLFIVVIVLLNVLIAQVSDTYSKVLSTAEGIYLYHQCRYIARLEAQQYYPGVLCYLLPRCFNKCCGAFFPRCFHRCYINCSFIPRCLRKCCGVCYQRCKCTSIVS